MNIKLTSPAVSISHFLACSLRRICWTHNTEVNTFVQLKYRPQLLMSEKKTKNGHELTKCLANQPPYLNSIFGNVTATTSPGSCWKAGNRFGFHSLADMAESLVSASPRSASLERHFSTMGLTYGILRSRLGVDKARKLCFLYRQLNNK